MPDADGPSALSLLSDYSKTTITLASGVLAISASFITAFIDRPLGSLGYSLLGVSWLLFIISIVASIFVAGDVIWGARHAEVAAKSIDTRAWNAVALKANVAFWSLAAGLVFLAAFVFVAQAKRENKPLDDLAAALRVVESPKNHLCAVDRRLARVISAAFDKADDRWTVVLRWPCVALHPNVNSYLLVTVTQGSLTSIQSTTPQNH